MPTLETHNGYYLWHYVPSIAASVIFLLIFFGLTAISCWRAWRSRTKFSIPFLIGGLLEFIGYTARAASYDRTGKLMPYVIQSVFILIGPALFAATIYMMLGRIVIHTNGEAYCRMPVRWLTKCFVGFDVLSLLLQAASASFTVTNIAPAAGKAMVLGGLVIQLVAFGGFCYVAAVYYRGFARAGLVKEDVWMMTMRMLFVISGLIMARSTFRVVEYSMGADGYLLTHEWPLYCFDAIPMATVMSAFFWWYPECLGRQVARSTDQEGGWILHSTK